ncbi:MAG: hypothetical protein BGO88_04960 [Flavobacterium sp. 38-13]|uniref:hypothetical protein n=1 Tax=Flavobacterium sp. 38-13 TaxID=1896168 RepID=UPI00095D8FF7|nr:hypothetical protein [Flavobacterium sp. 38-13]OJX55567.1 MAG: hypothetical protein BGO88_04960 [Flavobacterium sp. 38-13]
MNTYFTDYAILTSKIANILCDQIFDQVTQEFSGDVKYTDKFILSGRLSKNLQEELETPINNVVFITEDLDMFQYYQANAAKISPSATGIVHYKNRTLIYFKQVFIEVWFTSETLLIGKYENLPVQQVSQIPTETL